jgi:regulator of protease activity HflC (stomatin/prohibitin superfamily)
LPNYEDTRAAQQAAVVRIIKWAVVGVVALALLVLGSCGVDRVQPDAGTEAVLVKKPIMFGHGGVDPTPVKTGSTYVAWTTQPIMVNMQPQLFKFSSDDLMSSNGIPLHFDASLRLQVLDSVKLIEKFGERWYDNNVATEFASFVRQAVRRHSMNDLAIKTTGVDEADVEVTANMNRYLKSINLPVKLVKVTVGKATPPQEIKDQRIATAAAEQRQETEKATKIAEDNREAAERSRAVADNAYRSTLALDPAQFVELQRIKMQEEACVKKEGACTFIIGAGNPIVVSR